MAVQSSLPHSQPLERESARLRQDHGWQSLLLPSEPVMGTHAPQLLFSCHGSQHRSLGHWLLGASMLPTLINTSAA